MADTVIPTGDRDGCGRFFTTHLKNGYKQGIENQENITGVNVMRQKYKMPFIDYKNLERAYLSAAKSFMTFSVKQSTR